MKLLAVFGVFVTAIGCSTHSQTLSSLGVSCSDRERLEVRSSLLEAFAKENFGDPRRTEGTTEAVGLELIDRPTKLTRAHFVDGATLQVKLVNHLDKPVWVAERRQGNIGFKWVGEGVLYWYIESNLRVSCNEFSVIPPHGVRTVSVRLGGSYVHLMGSVLKLRLVYFMLPASVPLPPKGIIPVIGHAVSEQLEIEVEPEQPPTFTQ